MTNIQEEIWKDIPNYEGLYQASNKGSIKNTKSQRVLRPTICKTAYGKRYHVVLSKNRNQKTHKVHRLVISAFNGENILVVDHINGNPLDNRIENLRYCTQRENLTFNNVKRKKTSIYPGVRKRKNKWQAEIWITDRIVSCGIHDKEIDAYNSYLKARNGLMRGVGIFEK
jgi:hypothetical protein